METVQIGNPVPLFMGLGDHQKAIHAINNFMQAWNFSEISDPVERARESLCADPISTNYLFANGIAVDDALGYLINTMNDVEQKNDNHPNKKRRVFSRAYEIFLLRNTNARKCVSSGDYLGFRECLIGHLSRNPYSAKEALSAIFRLENYDNFILENLNFVRASCGMAKMADLPVDLKGGQNELL